MRRYSKLRLELAQTRHTWLVTGVAGFIGSNLLEALLQLDQRVFGLDNFSTGHQRNLDDVQACVAPAQWSNFTLLKGDIRNPHDCRLAVADVDYVLHEAALGSVPRSLADPVSTNLTNIDGFLNMLVAARDAHGGRGIKRFVYAASSSTYGDHPGLPKVEDLIGRPLSPYAVTKLVNELYADVFARAYGVECIGLRYFNVFGKRQDPEGAYAAVIPKWVSSMIRGDAVLINGDGETSRDFCFVENVVQANLLAALTTDRDARNQVYNVAVGERTTLNGLFTLLREILLPDFPHLANSQPSYGPFRPGDVRHSLASIEKASTRLGYEPSHRLESGLRAAMQWYTRALAPSTSR